jgi:NADH dehydrogenase
MSEISSDRSKKYLEKLGVKVMTGSHVKDYDGKNILLQDGQTISSATVLWAAGIKGNIPDGVDKSLIARGNRIKVDRQNRVIGSQNIYAIGDLAYMETSKYPNGHPQVATVAIQQAKLLAGNLVKIEAGKTDLMEYEYKDKGTMATVGRNLAVVDIPKPKLHFGGWFAWMIWMSLHLMLILGVKNKFFVFINWLYNYFTYDQSLRLIFKEFKKTKK